MTSGVLFGNDHPLEIEIGSGKGLFMAAQSIAHPNRNFIGIEIADKYARHAAGRIAVAQAAGRFVHEDAPDDAAEPAAASADEPADQTIPWDSAGPIPGNALMIAGDAQPILRDRIPDGSIDAIHVYFPDPWWKKRHRKRRVVNPSSVRSFIAALKPGGRFHFWTDVLDYFEITIEMIAQSATELGVPIPEDEKPPEHELDFRTHFERSRRNHAIPVYRVRWEKA